MPSNQRFAKDIVVYTQIAVDLQEMFQDLQLEARKTGFEMNITKTQFMRNKHTAVDGIQVDWYQVLKVNAYVYTG